MIRVEDSPPIILKIFDEDVTSDDFVGSVFVYLDQGVKEGYITINQQNLPKPKWLPLKLSNKI